MAPRSWRPALHESWTPRVERLRLTYFLSAPHRRSRGKGGGDEERDGREQLRGERLRSPEMFGPFPGGEEQRGRGRGIEVDSAERRGHVFFNDEADAVSGSQIVSVQTEPS